MNPAIITVTTVVVLMAIVSTIVPDSRAVPTEAVNHCVTFDSVPNDSFNFCVDS